MKIMITALMSFATLFSIVGFAAQTPVEQTISEINAILADAAVKAKLESWSNSGALGNIKISSKGDSKYQVGSGCYIETSISYGTNPTAPIVHIDSTWCQP